MMVLLIFCDHLQEEEKENLCVDTSCIICAKDRKFSKYVFVTIE